MRKCKAPTQQPGVRARGLPSLAALGQSASLRRVLRFGRPLALRWGVGRVVGSPFICRHSWRVAAVPSHSTMTMRAWTTLATSPIPLLSRDPAARGRPLAVATPRVGVRRRRMWKMTMMCRWRTETRWQMTPPRGVPAPATALGGLPAALAAGPQPQPGMMAAKGAPLELTARPARCRPRPARCAAAHAPAARPQTAVPAATAWTCPPSAVPATSDRYDPPTTCFGPSPCFVRPSACRATYPVRALRTRSWVAHASLSLPGSLSPASASACSPALSSSPLPLVPSSATLLAELQESKVPGARQKPTGAGCEALAQQHEEGRPRGWRQRRGRRRRCGDRGRPRRRTLGRWCCRWSGRRRGHRGCSGGGAARARQV